MYFFTKRKFRYSYVCKKKNVFFLYIKSKKNSDCCIIIGILDICVSYIHTHTHIYPYIFQERIKQNFTLSGGWVIFLYRCS